MNNNEILEKAFEKLSTGFMALGMAFSGMLLISLFASIGTQNTVDSISNSSLSETSNNLQNIISIIKFGSIICTIIATGSCFYLSSINISNIEFISNSKINSISNDNLTQTEEVKQGESNYKKIGSILLYNVFPEKMNWEKAKNKCTDLGEGWRLPSKDELLKIYESNKTNNIVGYSDDEYWSITSSVFTDFAYALSFNPKSKGAKEVNKQIECYVRAVKSI